MSDITTTPGRERLRQHGSPPLVWDASAPEPPPDYPLPSDKAKLSNFVIPQPSDSPEVTRYRSDLRAFLETRLGNSDQREYAVELDIAIRAERIRRDARAHLAQEVAGEPWGEVDFQAVFDGGIEIPIPSITLRTDGAGLFYRGEANLLYGDYSASKTSLVRWAMAEEIRQGHHVCLIDFENNRRKWAGRLIAMGLIPDDVIKHFHYFDLSTGARPPSELPYDPTLAVLDSITGALGATGFDPNGVDGIESVYRHMVYPFTEMGAAFVSLDHVGNADKSRPMNSIRKMGIVQGAAYRMDVLAGRPFGRGATGASQLTLQKDNNGGVGLPKGAIAGTFVMSISADDTEIRCHVEPPGALDFAAASAASQDAAQKKMDDVVRALQMNGPLSRSKLRTEAKGKADVVNAAIDDLIEAGVVRQTRVKNADLIELVD